MWKYFLVTVVGGSLALATALPEGQGTDRAMNRLRRSTREHPETVRILFYGQSITKQRWWRDVAEDLRQQFPTADLRIENRAIGGYSTSYLLRTMEADVLPFHPDLILFHDYGSEEQYEKIIRWMRSHTTAEILLQSDHVVWIPGEEDPNGSKRKGYDFQERHSFEWLPELAKRYGLGLVDIRGGWHREFAKTGLGPKDFLSDSVHLNSRGEALYARLTKQYLASSPQQEVVNSFQSIPLQWKGQSVEIEFSGNRVEIVGLQAGVLDVAIDGKRPAETADLYYHSRPTNTWDADWPTVMRVGHEAPLQIEDWVLKVIERNPSGTEFRFEVYGSVTGFDGVGSSQERFVSSSRRVILEPDDYDVVRSYGLKKIPMPGDWQIRWSSLPRFVDPVLPNAGAQTILYGLANERHRLRLTAPRGIRPLPGAVRVYQPTLKETH